MNQSNPYLRSTLLANQTVERLRVEGVSLDEAKRLVVQVINLEEAEMTRLRRPYDEAGMAERLKRLPDLLP
jgi:hypothetical protein